MVPRYKILVVDDEPLARERIRRLLATNDDADVQLSTNGEQAARIVERDKPDIVFLDIQMPGVDGFQFLARLGAVRPVVVFVTAFDNHAVRAFDAEAVDYLVKPFDDSRFEASYARAKAMVNHRRLSDAALQLTKLGQAQPRSMNAVAAAEGDAELEYTEGRLARVLVRDRNSIKVIPIADIDWIGADGNYVRIYAGKERPLHRSTLADFESRLDPRRFVRIHRSAVVNIDRVLELQEHSRGEYAAVLRDGTKLKVSRARRALLEQLLGG